MVLDQHRRHRIELRTEAEQREGSKRLPAPRHVNLVAIDVAHCIHVRGQLELRIVERKRARPRHLLIGGRIYRCSVAERAGDIHRGTGYRQLERLGRTAHREQKAAVLHELPHPLANRLLQVRDCLKAEPAGRRQVSLVLLDEPWSTAIGNVELAELAGEILVMQVQPVVLGKITAHHFVVPERRVLDPGITKRERHRIVPRRRIGRGVNSDLGSLLERNRVHVSAGDLTPDRRQSAIVDRLGGDAVERCLATERFQVRQQKGAAAIVEQPLAPHSILERPVREAIRLEMVALRVIHRDEQVLGARNRGRAREQESGARESN